MDLSNLLADNGSERSVTVKVKPSQLPKDLGDMMDGGSRPAMPPGVWSAPEPENPFVSEVKRMAGTAIGLPYLIYYLLKEGALSSPSSPRTPDQSYPGMMSDEWYRKQGKGQP